MNLRTLTICFHFGMKSLCFSENPKFDIWVVLAKNDFVLGNIIWFSLGKLWRLKTFVVAEMRVSGPRASLLSLFSRFNLESILHIVFGLCCVYTTTTITLITARCSHKKSNREVGTGGRNRGISQPRKQVESCRNLGVLHVPLVQPCITCIQMGTSCSRHFSKSQP